MKIVFFGTPDYVVPVADGLLKHFRTNANQHPIAAVVTQSPKPSGREKFMSYSPVDEWAYERKISKYFDPNDIIKERIDADIGILASYGQIIPEPVIKYFRYGILNIHPSLLPLWRGASPIQASIISGNATTGVSIIKLDDKLDHGHVVSQFKDEITETDTTESLRKRLFDRSAEVMPTLIEAYTAGKITPKKQEEDKATFTRQIKKEDGFIEPKFLNNIMQGRTLQNKWEIPFVYKQIRNPKSEIRIKEPFKLSTTTENIYNFIRAMDPWPGAWSNIKATSDKSQVTRRIKILKAHIEKDPTSSRLSLIPDIVQLEGKSPVSWKQFIEGYPEAKFV